MERKGKDIATFQPRKQTTIFYPTFATSSFTIKILSKLKLGAVEDPVCGSQVKLIV